MNRKKGAASTTFTVMANTVQTAAEAGGNLYHGSHPVASTVTVMGNTNGEPAFIQIRNIAPAEVLILIREY